jgi:hypothetical protein
MKKKEPTLKQKRAIELLVENHGNISKSMREAGYTEASAKNPKNLTNSLGYKSIADQIPDALLVKKHNDLLKQKQLSYFVFSKSLSDEEIIEHMKANNLDTIVIRESDKGKLAFYSIDDAQAISKGLDMAYKLKGSFAELKTTIKIESSEEEKESINKVLGNL